MTPVVHFAAFCSSGSELPWWHGKTDEQLRRLLTFAGSELGQRRRRELPFRMVERNPFIHAALGWLCKPEVAGSIPARSTGKGPGNGAFLVDGVGRELVDACGS